METARRVSRSTLATQVEAALRLDIIEGVLEPGQRLRTAELAQRYSVSATPLREALQRLAAENLVEIDPRFGATVAPISESDLHDIYWLRRTLESLALEQSLARSNSDWDERVRQAWAEFRTIASAEEATAQPLAWSRAHRAFHEALLSASGSPWLERTLNLLYDHSERYRMVSMRRRPRNTVSEHQRIFEAAISRDTVSAVEALAQHLERTVAALDSPGSESEDANQGVAGSAS